MIAAVKAEELARAIFEVADDGLFQALYRLTWVSDRAVLSDLREAGLEAESLDELGGLPTEQLDAFADTYIRRARRAAAVSGISLGAGGLLSLPPGLGHLVVVIVRMAQRISLVYGFDYRTDRGEIELWKGLARATGAEVDWEGTEAELMRRLPAVVTGTGTFANPLMLRAFQAVVIRIALAAGLRLGRWVPGVVGGGSGALLNWLQVRSIGRSLKDDWRAMHALGHVDTAGAIEVEILQQP
jgi:hypothetical protein